MSSKSPNLGLALTGLSEADKSIIFEDWRSGLDGENVTSNMQIIDAAYKLLLDKIHNLETLSEIDIARVKGLAEALAALQPIGNYLTSETDPTVPAWAKAAAKPKYTAAEVGASDSKHTHTLASLGAASATHTHTPEELGAAGAGHTHTPASIGAAPEIHTHTADSVGAAQKIHTHTPEELGVAKADHTHAALTNIDQDVKKTASPTFNVVTATKVIGAVYQ